MSEPTAAPQRARRDRVHYLYLAVLGAVVLGAAVGLAARTSRRS